MAASALVNLVEYRLHALPDPATTPEVARVARQIRRRQVDTLVLGCTHFVHLRAALQQSSGPQVAIIDSCAGVAQRVVHLLSTPPAAQPNTPHAAQATAGHDDTLWLTGTAPVETRYTTFATRFGLRPAGIL